MIANVKGAGGGGTKALGMPMHTPPLMHACNIWWRDTTAVNRGAHFPHAFAPRPGVALMPQRADVIEHELKAATPTAR